MSDVFVVNGTRRSLIGQSVSITHAENQQASLSAELYLTLGDWMPAVMEEIGVWSHDAPVGYARTFNGSTSVLAGSLATTDVDDITIMAWARTTDNTTGQEVLHNGLASNGYAIRVASGVWQGVIAGGTVVSSDAAAAENTWVHLAFRRASTTWKLFVNGVSQTGSTTTAPTAPTTTFTVGARRNAGDTAYDLPFSGDICHVAVFEAALTDAQILAIARSGAGWDGRAPDAIATPTVYYRIDGAASPEPDITDSVSLTVTDAPATSTGPIIVPSDADVKFAGEINDVQVAGRGNWSSTKLVVSITAVDFNSYPDRVIQSSVDFVSESLAARLTRIQQNVPQFVTTTVASDQPTGPTLVAHPASNAPIRDLLTKTQEESGGYLFDINAFKEMSMRLPSAVSAPFDIDTTSGADGVVGDVVVRRTVSAGYINFLRVFYGAGTRLVNDVFTGDGVEDTFSLSVPFDALSNFTVNVNSGTYQTLVVDAPGSGGAWELDTATNTLTRAAGALPNTHTAQLDYLGRFPVEALTYTDVPSGGSLYGGLLELPEVYDASTANTRGTEHFDLVSVIPEQVTYATYTEGLRPGQEQDITVPQRGFDETCRITDVVIETDGLRWRHTITAVVSGKVKNWRDTWKGLAA